MIISPAISYNNVPALAISTGLPSFTYDQLLRSLGTVVFRIDTLFYSASSLPQFFNPIQYAIRDADGNKAGQQIVNPVSPKQYQPSMWINLVGRGIVIDGQAEMSFNLLAQQSLQMLFYGGRRRNQDVMDAAGQVNNFMEVEKALGNPAFFTDVKTEEMICQAIMLFITNNSSGTIPVSLLSPDFPALDIANDTTRYSWDITGQDLSNLQFSMQAQWPGAAMQTYSGMLAAATPQALVAALNNLNIGVFWLEESGGNTYVVTFNDLIVYGNMQVGAALPVAFTLDADIAAPGDSLNFAITGTGVKTGQIDYGDGTVVNFSTAAIINASHAYAAAGNYTATVYLSTPVSNITELLAANPASRIIGADITALTSLTSLTLINQQLAGIDISQNTALQSLQLQNNVITAVDVSANPALVLLFVHENQLTALDTLTNVLLSNINIADNNLPVAVINSTLINADNSGVINGTYKSDSQTPPAAPSGAGLVAEANLIGNGWTIATD